MSPDILAEDVMFLVTFVRRFLWALKPTPSSPFKSLSVYSFWSIYILPDIVSSLLRNSDIKEPKNGSARHTDLQKKPPRRNYRIFSLLNHRSHGKRQYVSKSFGNTGFRDYLSAKILNIIRHTISETDRLAFFRRGGWGNLLSLFS
jgi:hypothetical protein